MQDLPVRARCTGLRGTPAAIPPRRISSPWLLLPSFPLLAHPLLPKQALDLKACSVAFSLCPCDAVIYKKYCVDFVHCSWHRAPKMLATSYIRAIGAPFVIIYFLMNIN